MSFERYYQAGLALPRNVYAPMLRSILPSDMLSRDAVTRDERRMSTPTHLN